MKTTLKFLLLLTCWVGALSNPQWVLLDSTASRTVYYDAAHIGVHNRNATLWTFTKYKTEKYAGYNVQSKAIVQAETQNGDVSTSTHTRAQLTGDGNSYTYNTERQQYDVSCVTRTTADIMLLRYMDDEVVRSWDWSFIPRSYTSIVPGTLGAAIYNTACPEDVNSYAASTARTNKHTPSSKAPDTQLAGAVFVCFAVFVALVVVVAN